MSTTADNIRRILRQTLDDRRLSRGEKRVVDSILDELSPSDQQLGLFRSIAFDLAREEMATGNPADVLDWLDDVTRVIANQTETTVTTSVAETHFSPGDDCPQRIRSLLARAKRRVEICVFTITDNRISDAVADAHARGVNVRIITDDDKATDRGSDIDRLEGLGVAVRCDNSSYHMHHKFALFDADLLLTGSYNWTRGAAEYNEENFLITGDPRFIRPFATLFEELWKKFATSA
ncbi:MAG: endonuclease [Planctomycetaceae bacterium]|nr:endonuclease [Planctomycetaceae bacterium]